MRASRCLPGSRCGAARAFVTRLDAGAELAAARLRGHRGADAVAVAASALADHGLLWFLLGVVRGRHPGARRTQALWAVGYTGLTSPLLNTVTKRVVRRGRPAAVSAPPAPAAAAAPLVLRRPTSTSFPSGHTLAAFSSATIFAAGQPAAAGCYGLATLVAWSRVHVGHHHASDVLAGAALGWALGHTGRALQRRWVGVPRPRPDGERVRTAATAPRAIPGWAGGIGRWRAAGVPGGAPPRSPRD